jgi:hypothetical protein
MLDIGGPCCLIFIGNLKRDLKPQDLEPKGCKYTVYKVEMDYNLHQFSYDPFYGMFRKLVFWEKIWSWWLVVGIIIIIC